MGMFAPWHWLIVLAFIGVIVAVIVLVVSLSRSNSARPQPPPGMTPPPPMTAPPGWYPDPADPSRSLYWNGYTWAPPPNP